MDILSAIKAREGKNWVQRKTLEQRAAQNDLSNSRLSNDSPNSKLAGTSPKRDLSANNSRGKLSFMVRDTFEQQQNASALSKILYKTRSHH